jgi:chemotaxis-related protein WspB
MLLLLFQIRKSQYALDSAQVAEVLPFIRFKPTFRAPTGVVGVFNYHGNPVPLIDLGKLLAEQPTPAKMASRIIVTNPNVCGTNLQIGLLVEELMETLRCANTDFSDDGGTVPSSCFTPVTVNDGRIVHRLDINRLLAPAFFERLLSAPMVAE